MELSRSGLRCEAISGAAGLCQAEMGVGPTERKLVPRQTHHFLFRANTHTKLNPKNAPTGYNQDAANLEGEPTSLQIFSVARAQKPRQEAASSPDSTTTPRACQ